MIHSLINSQRCVFGVANENSAYVDTLRNRNFVNGGRASALAKNRKIYQGCFKFNPYCTRRSNCVEIFLAWGGSRGCKTVQSSMPLRG